MSTRAGSDQPRPGAGWSEGIGQHRSDPSTPPEGPELPSGSPWWLPTICLVPSLTESSFAWLTRGVATPGLETWDDFASWITDAGLAEVEPGVQPTSLVVRPEPFPVLDALLDRLLDSDETRSRLLAPADPHLGPSRWVRAGKWARLRSRWDVLEDVWLVLSEDEGDIPSEALGDFLDLPDAARRDYPILSWAAAVAEAHGIQPASQQVRMLLNRLRLDSALVHADWAQREDTNAAVAAGTVRMVGQRGLPQSGRPLEAAWRTKADIDRFIDERSRVGRPPGRVTSSFFRVMSAWVCLFRADLPGAVEEARWAAIFAESASISTLAAAIETFASSLAGELEPYTPGDVPVPPTPDRYQFGGLRQIAAVLAQLASGRRALQALDRAGVERALAATAPETTMISGVWAVRVALAAFQSAIWGDPALGLHKLFADLATQPMGVREQDEPLGGLLTGRARELLLDKIGHFGAAAQCADSLDERFRVLPQARTRLWSGQLGAAVQLVERALPDPELLHADRLQLLIIRGAATTLDGSITSEIRKRTLSALRTMLLARDFLPMALLPGAARDAVLDMGEALADEPDTSAALALLKERLGTDVDNTAPAARLFHLTERETVLLPLLATDMSVTEIAKQLHVSVHTVRKQVATLREKFQAPTRAELVRKAGVYGSIL